MTALEDTAREMKLLEKLREFIRRKREEMVDRVSWYLQNTAHALESHASKKTLPARLETLAGWSGIRCRVEVRSLRKKMRAGDVKWGGECWLVTIDSRVGDKERILAHELGHTLAPGQLGKRVVTPDDEAAFDRWCRHAAKTKSFSYKNQVEQLEADAWADNLIRDWAARLGLSTRVVFGRPIPRKEGDTNKVTE